MPKKVLLVTEGPGDKKVLSNLFRTFSLSNIDIVTFKTDIHYLGRLYEAQHQPYDDIDLQNLLLWEKNDLTPNERQILLDRYVDKFLIFDFDPQAPQADFIELKKLMTHFSDSSEAGKLYINYPMLESYRHIDRNCLQTLSLDVGFFERMFYEADVQKGSSRANYKTRSGKEGFTQRALTENQWRIIIDHHLQKTKKILGISEEFNFSQNNFIKLFDEQLYLFKEQHKGYVLNTSILIFPELFPSLWSKFATGNP